MNKPRGYDGPLPRAVFDDWLREQFPGRTLEELDDMDMGRFRKACEVRQLKEFRRTLDHFFDGTLSDDQRSDMVRDPLFAEFMNA